MEFLYSLNRLNVATSRARCAAIIVASHRLFEPVRGEVGRARAARDGDVGAVFGIGFPPFRGGPFRYMDTVGIAEIVRRLDALNTRFAPRFEAAEILRRMAADGGRFYAQ